MITQIHLSEGIVEWHLEDLKLLQPVGLTGIFVEKDKHIDSLWMLLIFRGNEGLRP